MHEARLKRLLILLEDLYFWSFDWSWIDIHLTDLEEMTKGSQKNIVIKVIKASLVERIFMCNKIRSLFNLARLHTKGFYVQTIDIVGYIHFQNHLYHRTKFVQISLDISYRVFIPYLEIKIIVSHRYKIIFYTTHMRQGDEALFLNLS